MANLDFLDCLANELVRRGVVDKGHIFVGKLPAKPNNVVALFGQTGTVVQQQRDVPGLHFPRFQAICRATGYNDASDLAEAVRGVLHGMIGVELPYLETPPRTGQYIRVMRCHLEYEGGPLGEDAQGRPEFSANYLAEYHFYEATEDVEA